VAVTSHGESFSKGVEQSLKKRTKPIVFKQVSDQKKGHCIIVMFHPTAKPFNANEKLIRKFRVGMKHLLLAPRRVTLVLGQMPEIVAIYGVPRSHDASPRPISTR
jgi:hypothetical protein